MSTSENRGDFHYFLQFVSFDNDTKEQEPLESQIVEMFQTVALEH